MKLYIRPAKTAGPISGKLTRAMVSQRLAPDIWAASSSAGSSAIMLPEIRKNMAGVSISP